MMKHLLYIFFCFVLISGCKKHGPEDRVSDHGLVGKWTLTETFMSPGAGGSWYPYNGAAPMNIEFTGTGEFICTSNFPRANMQYNRYTLSGSKVDVSSTNNSNTDTWTIHYLDANRLDIAILACFEGCDYRFTYTGQ